MAFLSGARFGPYEVLAPLGQGGMGEVYRAIDTRLDRTVAIKMLAPEVADSPVRRQRFEREARAVSSLNHPNICSLYDVGEQNGAPFLVMEYVDGETLAHRLVRGALSIDQVLRYSVGIAGGLDHAHRHGIIHRDLKPANIMLTRAGVKLLDFGVARLGKAEPIAGGLPGAAQPLQTITEEGTVVGTLQYMAPEQLEARDTDARIDIFAFGAVVYEMATGQQAFDGPSRASVIAAILDHDPAPLSGVRRETPPLLDQIVTRCLAKNPDDRWQTASDLKQALMWITDQSAQIGGLPTLSRPARHMHRGWVAAAALAVLASLTAIALATMASRRVSTDAASFRFIVPPPRNANFSQSSAFMAVSPDGRSLAFIASSGEGNDTLWVRSLDTLNARQLAGTDGAARPFWSPDSRFLAFSGIGADTLKKIDVVNGFSQTVAGARAAPGTWNDDGVILFPGGLEQGGLLYRISASGGSPAPATSSDRARAETNHIWPQFLPDGRHFIFLARSAQPEHDGVVYVGSLDSTDRVRVVSADSHAVYAPQGYVLFMRENTLVAQAFDPTTLRLTGEPVPLAEQVERTPGSRRGAFSISRTGVLAYRPIGETRLAWYDRGGKLLQSIGPPGQYSNPALSPDEQRIAVGRLDFETGASDIWVIDLASGGLASRFTFDAAPEEMPLWSPDGSRIIFKFKTGFYQKVSTGTGNSELLLSNVGSFGNPLDWSHGGRSLLYQTLDRDPKATLDLWMLPLVGDRKPVAGLRTEFQEGQAHPSPDGRWMAYVSNESGKNEVYVRAFPFDGSKRQVSTQGGLEPMWRGDGKELFYLAPDRRLMSVVVKSGSRFEASLPTLLFETRMSVAFSPSYTRNQYVVSADGQRFLINQPPAGVPSSPITVVVNWQAALKR